MLIYLALIDSPEEQRKFEQIYNEHKQTMYYAANRILKDTFAAEDIVHQAFLRIIDNMEKIEEVNCPQTRKYVIVITEHIAIDFYRKRKRENLTSYDELEIFIPDESRNSDILNEVVAAISKLPVNYYIVFELKYVQGYSNIEIAIILKTSAENVKKRITRGKKKLSELLNREV